MKSILYVDDNKDMIELVELVLSKSGYQLVSNTDPQATVSLCMEKRPDLLLLDLHMPGMEGFEVTRELRQQGFTNPIIVFTASESNRDKEKAYQAGCDEYIVKDLEMRSLEHVIDTYLIEAGGI